MWPGPGLRRFSEAPKEQTNKQPIGFTQARFASESGREVPKKAFCIPMSLHVNSKVQHKWKEPLAGACVRVCMSLVLAVIQRVRLPNQQKPQVSCWLVGDAHVSLLAPCTEMETRKLNNCSISYPILRRQRIYANKRAFSRLETCFIRPCLAAADDPGRWALAAPRGPRIWRSLARSDHGPLQQ